MLKAIFSSILSALHGLAGFIFSVPFRLFGHLFGGAGGDHAAEIPQVRPYDAAMPRDGVDAQAVHLANANKLMAWAADFDRRRPAGGAAGRATDRAARLGARVDASRMRTADKCR